MHHVFLDAAYAVFRRRPGGNSHQRRKWRRSRFWQIWATSGPVTIHCAGGSEVILAHRHAVKVYARGGRIALGKPCLQRENALKALDGEG